MELEIDVNSWPLNEPFVISRGAIESVELLTVTVREDGIAGRGEGAPQAFMGQTCEAARDELARFWEECGGKVDRRMVNDSLPPTAARNALDCALWDLEVKRNGTTIWDAIGIAAPKAPLHGGMTISLGTHEDMARQAAREAKHGLLKVKLGAGDMCERMMAVRDAAPDARLIVDLNEAWGIDDLASHAPFLASIGVEMIEQPLPRGGDAELLQYDCPLPLAADESCHTSADLDYLAGRYDLVNIKLDKTGGLTEALQLARAAEARGFRLMVGCMVATSLSMAPAFVIGALCDYCDLDGSTLLAEDRTPPIQVDGGLVHRFSSRLWG